MNFNSAAIQAHGSRHRLAHRTAMADSLLELHRDVLRDNLRIELGLTNFGDIHLNNGGRIDFANKAVQCVGELIDAFAATADDGAGPRGENGDLYAIGGALDFNAGNVAETDALLDVFADLVIEQQRGAIALLAVIPMAIEATNG